MRWMDNVQAVGAIWKTSRFSWMAVLNHTLVQAVGALQYTPHGQIVQAVGARGFEGRVGTGGRANHTTTASDDPARRGRTNANERSLLPRYSEYRTSRCRTCEHRLAYFERLLVRHLAFCSHRGAYAHERIVRLMRDSFAHFAFLRSFVGVRSNGGDSGPSGMPPAVRFAATRTLRRCGRHDGRTTGEEVIKHSVRLFTVQHPSRTLRFDRASERYAKVTANELARNAKRSSNVLRAAVLARSNRRDCSRFLRSVLGIGRHVFTPSRDVRLHRCSVARPNVRHAFECKGIVNRSIERTFATIRKIVRSFANDVSSKRSIERTMCAHNDRTFERCARTMMARTYEHTFAPPAAPPKEELTYLPRGVRAQRAGRIFAATIEAAY
jgi:hypothetical protein